MGMVNQQTFRQKVGERCQKVSRKDHKVIWSNCSQFFMLYSLFCAEQRGGSREKNYPSTIKNDCFDPSLCFSFRKSFDSLELPLASEFIRREHHMKRIPIYLSPSDFLHQSDFGMLAQGNLQLQC